MDRTPPAAAPGHSQPDSERRGELEGGTPSESRAGELEGGAPSESRAGELEGGTPSKMGSPPLRCGEGAGGEVPAAAGRSDRRLCVFAKIPEIGKVKTRLFPALSPGNAAWLALAFLNDLSEELAGGPYDLRFVWAAEAGEELPRHEGIPSERQAAGDLGERLYACCAAALEAAAAVVIVGSDHPELERSRVIAAFETLESGSPVVIGPSADGGYYLIGLRREGLAARYQDSLFAGIPWSTGEVFAATRARCRTAGLEEAVLPVGYDVDTPEDLDALAARLRVSPRRNCGFTRVLLEEWGRL